MGPGWSLQGVVHAVREGHALEEKKAKMRFINGMVLSRPEYTSMFVYFFSFIFHPARVLFGSAR